LKRADQKTIYRRVHEAQKTQAAVTKSQETNRLAEKTERTHPARQKKKALAKAAEGGRDTMEKGSSGKKRD